MLADAAIICPFAGIGMSMIVLAITGKKCAGWRVMALDCYQHRP